nr:MAG TPA: hypothetical protein [Caudoviricetes sp.]
MNQIHRRGCQSFPGLYAVQAKLNLYVHTRLVKNIEISQGM